jgi:O-antigen ligase
MRKPLTLAVLLKQTSRILFLAALAGAPVVAGTLDPHWGAWTPAAGALTCSLLVAAALHLLARRLANEPARLATPIDGPILLLLAATFLSVLASVNRHASLLEALRILTCVVAFALSLEMVYEALHAADSATAGASTLPAGREQNRRKREPRRGGPAATLAGGSQALRLDAPLVALWIALIAGAAWAGARGDQEYLAALRDGLGAWRVFGGFSHPNTLIAHLALTMPLMAGAALALRSRRDSLCAAWPIPTVALVIALAASAFTGSRLGFLAVGLGFLVFLLAYLAIRRSVTPVQAALIAAGFVLAGVLVVLAVPTLRYRVVAAFTGAEAFSLQFRLTTWAAAWRCFLAHPLAGSGIGTFPAIMTRYSETSWAQTAHNHFAQTAAETGILGIAGLLLLLILWFITALRGMRGCKPESASETLRAPLLAAALGGVAASTAYAAVDFGWSIAATGWVLWALMGAGVAAAGGVRRMCARARMEQVALGLLVAMLLPAGALTLASWHHQQAMLLKSRAPMAAVEEFTDALRIDPYAPETHRELGRLLGGLGLVSGDREQIDAGLSHLEQAARLAPTMALNAYHLGLLAMRAGETERAVAAFRHALEWDPNSPPAWRQLGSLFERSHPEETLRAARRLVEIEQSPYGTIRPLGEHVDPNYAFGHYWMGEHLRQSGDAVAARAEHEKAREILTRYRESLLGIAGLTPEGTAERTPEPEIQALEAAISRTLAKSPAPQ